MPASFVLDNQDAILQEDDTCFLLSMEMPNVNGKDIHISLHENTLLVGGYRRSSEDDQESCDRASSSQRRKRQRISRTFAIDPEKIDIDRAIANMFNGYLTLYAPKRVSYSSNSSAASFSDEEEVDYTF